MLDDGVYDPPAPFTCIACRTGRCDLCSHPANVYCECSHDTSTIHETSTDTLATSTCFSKDGAMHVGTPTLAQWKAQQALATDVHHVRWAPGHGAAEGVFIDDRLEKVGDL